MKQKILLSVLMVFLVQIVNAQSNYYWKPAGANTSAKIKSNWKIGSCTGASATVFPGSSDTLIFTNCSANNASLDTSFNVAYINLRSNYNGAVTQSGSNTITAKKIRCTGGTLSGGSATITVTASILIDGGTFTSTSVTLTLSGSFAKTSGTFNHNNGKIIFRKPASGQPGINSNSKTTAVNFYDVVFDAPDVTTSFSISNILFTVNNSMEISGDEQLFLNGDTILMAGASSLVLTNTSNTGGGTSKIKYNSSSTQSITGNTGSEFTKLPNVIINKSGTLNLTGNIAMGGSTYLHYKTGTISEGTSNFLFFYNDSIKGKMKFYNLEFEGHSSNYYITDTITITHNMILSGTAYNKVNNGAIKLGNDMIYDNSNGTSIVNTSVLFVSTSADQAVTGTSVATVLKLVVNKPNRKLTLQNPINVVNYLGLVAGYIQTDAINILTVNAGCSVVGGSNSSFIKGPLKKIGNTAFTFPVGKGTTYKAIVITAPSSTTDAFTAEYFAAEQTLGSDKDSLTYLSSCEYWNLARTTGSSNVKVTLTWDNTTCDIYTLQTLKVARWDGSKWSNTGMATTTGTTASGSVQTNNALSAFGNFIIAKKSPLLTVNAGTTKIICNTGSVTIGGSPTASVGLSPFTYTWSPSTGLSTNTTANPTASPSSSTTYTVTVQDLDHTLSTGSIQVIIDPAITVNAGPDTTLCGLSYYHLGGEPTASGGTAPYAYLWSPATYIETDSIVNSNPPLFPETTTTYSITVTDHHGCTASDNVTINVNPAVYSHAGHDTVIFIGQSVTLGGTPVATAGTYPYTYNWSPSTALNATSVEHPTCTPMGSQQYLVKVVDVNGCLHQEDVFITVSAPFYTLSSDFAMLSGDSIIVKDSLKVYGKIGATNFIDSKITSTDSILLNTASQSNALVKLDSTINFLHRMAGTSITGNLNDSLLSPGIYKISDDLFLSDTVTLQGNSLSYFVFDISDSFLCENGATIQLQGGVTFQNVIFRVASAFRALGTVNIAGIFLLEQSFSAETIRGLYTVFSKSTIQIDVDPSPYSPSITPVLLSGTERLLPADLIGYNGNTLSNEVDIELSWQRPEVLDSMPKLFPTVIRFPAGGETKTWNWNDGWWLNETEMGNSVALSFLPACVTFDYNKPLIHQSRFIDLKKGLHGAGASSLVLINPFAKNQFEKDKLKHAYELGLPLKYVELGNELYLKGNYCLFKNAWEYAAFCNDWLLDIHSTYNLSTIGYEINVGIVASAYTATDKSGCRFLTWNSDLGLPNVDNLLNNMQDGDAITFHIYPSAFTQGLGPPGEVIEPSFLPKLFIRPFQVIDDLIGNEFKSIPEIGGDKDIRIWISEFNLDEQFYYIHGSWAHSLWLAGLCLDFLREPRIDKIICHTLVNDAFKGMIISSNKGFLFGDPVKGPKSIDWSGTLLTNAFGLTSAGNSMKLIAEAAKNAISATELDFPNATLIDEDHNYKSIYGWQFDKADDKQLIIINYSANVAYINTSGLISMGSYEQVAIPQYAQDILNPVSYYAKGELNNGYNLNYVTSWSTLPPPIEEDLNLIHTFSVINFGQVQLLPYSITRVYQTNPINMNVTGIVTACEGGSLNLFASGAHRFEWSVEINNNGNPVFTYLNTDHGDIVSFREMGVDVLNSTSTYEISAEGFSYNNVSIGTVSQIITVNEGPGGVITPSGGSINNYCPTDGNPVILTATYQQGPSMDYYDWYPTEPITSISVVLNEIVVNPTKSTEIVLIGSNATTNCTSEFNIPISSGSDISIVATGGVSIQNDEAFVNLLQMNYCFGDCSSPTLSVENPYGNYTWSPSDGLNTSTGSTVTLLPNIGINTTYTVTDINCGSQKSAYIEVKNAPSLTEDYIAVCEGEEKILEVEWLVNDNCGNVSVNYQWQVNGVDINGETNNTYTVNTDYLSGDYNFRVKITPQSCPGYDFYLNAFVTITAAPILGDVTIESPYSANDIVSGFTMPLHADCPANFIIWNPGNFLNNISEEDVSFTPIVTGCTDIKITATTSNNDCCSSQDQMINIWPMPHITLNPYNACCFEGEYSVYIDNADNPCDVLPTGYDYYWVDGINEYSISDLTIPYTFSNANTPIKVKVQDPGFAVQYSNIVEVIPSQSTCCENIEERQIAESNCDFMLYPNPTSIDAFITFYCEEILTFPIYLEIATIQGNKLFSGKYDNKEEIEAINLNFLDLPAGYYLILIESMEVSLKNQFIIVK